VGRPGPRSVSQDARNSSCFTSTSAIRVATLDSCSCALITTVLKSATNFQRMCLRVFTQKGCMRVLANQVFLIPLINAHCQCTRLMTWRKFSWLSYETTFWTSLRLTTFLYCPEWQPFNSNNYACLKECFLPRQLANSYGQTVLAYHLRKRGNRCKHCERIRNPNQLTS